MWTKWGGQVRKLLVQLESQLWRAYLTMRGVRCGRALTLAGRPLVTGAKRGLITLGERVELVSVSNRTNLGVRAPTIIRILAPAASITIGDDTGISGAVICAAQNVKIGKRCLLGADVMVFDTDFHHLEPEGRRYGQPDWPKISAAVVIEDDVFIGTRSIVMKGVTIGRGSVVGAGSVVTSDVPPMTLVAGVPARHIRSL